MPTAFLFSKKELSINLRGTLRNISVTNRFGNNKKYPCKDIAQHRTCKTLHIYRKFKTTKLKQILVNY